MKKESVSAQSPMNGQVDDQLIVRYLAGEATPEEAMALHDWLTVPENNSYYQGIANAWDRARPGRRSTPSDAGAAWHSVDSRTVPRPSTRWTVLKVAAAVAAVSAICYVVFHESARQPEHITIHAARQKEVQLPDRSTVVMYDNTVMTYPDDFATGEREVTFNSGEAYFSVQHDQDKPFVIHGPSASVRVVGTRFNLVATGSTTQVSVTEGRVILYNHSDSAVLDPGFTGIATADPIIRVTPTEDANQWAYATKKLVFRDARMDEVIESVEKSYHCTIETGNVEINQCRLTASFEPDSAENVVHLIAESLNLSVTQHGMVFKLDGPGCR